MAKQAAIYTRRILNSKNRPICRSEQATKIELVINPKTAKSLGLTIPETLLATNLTFKKKHTRGGTRSTRRCRGP